MAPLHEIPGVVEDPVTKPPRCEESCSDSDDEEAVSSKGDARTDETPISISSSHQSLRGDVTFPIKLHEMLMDVEREDNGSIVSWSPDGKGFRVHKQNLFVKTILPRYFSQTKYRSFQRQLNHYGFDRIIKGPYEGGYRHPDFVKDDPSRCRSMRRLKRNTIPKRVPRDEKPTRHHDSSLYGTDKVVAVSPDPSHHGSPKRHFDPTGKSLISFPSPMFRPVPQYHRARIVTGTPLPVHPPGTRVYYHNHPPPSQPPRVTHVYYIAPPDFHHMPPPPYHMEYPHGGRAPPTYHAYYAKATVVPLSPHNHVHLRPSYEDSPRRNPDLFLLSAPPSARNPPMGMVPVEEEQVPEPERAAVPLESSKPPRHRRHSFSSVNSNQEKSIDDLLLDFLSDDDEQGPPNQDGDDDEILSSFTREKNVLNKNPQSQFPVNEPECDYSHDLVDNFKGCSVNQSNHHPQLDPTNATQTVAL